MPIGSLLETALFCGKRMSDLQRRRGARLHPAQRLPIVAGRYWF
jgi:hypothetical protein